MMDLIFWGTRGSVPVSGPQFLRYGGATMSIEVRLHGASEQTPDQTPDQTPQTPERVVFDCGTGLAEMGKRYGLACNGGLILQTHMHWDHIQGFPFFASLFNPKASFDLWAVPREGRSFKQVLGGQMCRPTFPVGLEIVPASLNFEDLPEKGSRVLGALRLSWIELWHPGGGTAYRLDYGGSSLVFTGDVEVAQGCRERLVEFARGADVLVMDAQYFPEEYESRQGFGHSTVLDAVDVARRAQVGRLLMTHHDPTHDDHRLEEKLALARGSHLMKGGRSQGLMIDNAYDGLRVAVGPRARPMQCIHAAI